MLKAIAAKFGFVSQEHVNAQLNYGYSIAKRLDEHREVVEQIQQKTSLFDEGYWHVDHLAMQDDYLIRLFRMVHDCWPEEVAAGVSPSNNSKVHPVVRARPAILGPCRLPEYRGE